MKSVDRRIQYSAVSLFTNCGAGDLGFADAGFSFHVMAEIDPRRLSVALLNHPGALGVPGDLRETLPKVVAAYRERAMKEPLALLAACPPCQGLSSVQSARGHESDADAGSRDARNLLVEVIASAAAQLQPRIVVVENVQAFLTRKVRHPSTAEPVSAASFLIDELSDAYLAFPMLADLADFGVPQSRKRSFLTFVHRSDAAIDMLARRGWAPYPFPSHSSSARGNVALRDALSAHQLPPLDAASSTKAESTIDLHCVPVWPEQRYRMVNAIPGNSGMSAWDNDRCLRCHRRTPDR